MYLYREALWVHNSGEYTAHSPLIRDVVHQTENTVRFLIKFDSKRAMFRRSRSAKTPRHHNHKSANGARMIAVAAHGAGACATRIFSISFSHIVRNATRRTRNLPHMTRSVLVCRICASHAHHKTRGGDGWTSVLFSPAACLSGWLWLVSMSMCLCVSGDGGD